MKQENMAIGVSIRGHKISLDTSNEAIREICMANNFPVVKYGDEIVVLCKCGCGEATLAKIMGVGSCQSKIMACFDCYMATGRNAIWISTDRIPGKITFVDPRDVYISLIS